MYLPSHVSCVKEDSEGENGIDVDFRNLRLDFPEFGGRFLLVFTFSHIIMQMNQIIERLGHFHQSPLQETLMGDYPSV